MFIQNDVLEFINRIINSQTSSASEIKKNLILFRDYLALTEMTDKQTIDKVDKILDCLEGLLQVKKSLGVVDISVIINAPNTEKGKALKKIPIIQHQYADKHYHHYERDNSSSSCYTCGSSSNSSSSSCYTCGASSTSRSRC
jgi:hypothetical protein